MRVKDKGIILQAIKYGDKKQILKIYTKNHGLVTVIAIAGKSPSSKIRSSNILPLTLVELEVILKQNKEINRLTEVSCYSVHNRISTSLSKLGIAQFINEILLKTVKEQNTGGNLYEFIETCLKFLNDSEHEYINLHLYFLMELSKYLGFEPQNNFAPGTPYFDCREGCFTPLSLGFPLGLAEDDSKLFSDFLKINSLKTNISNAQRQNLLEIWIAYYKLHIPGFNELRSLEVLREVQAG